jgi:predicted esterase YcpF (UPF0227 family)
VRDEKRRGRSDRIGARCDDAHTIESPAVTPVLYLHGFASSPASAKIGLLRARVERDIALHTPDLNVPSFEQLDFEAAVDRAYERGTATGARVIAGSSLGALMALAVARRGLAVPLLLIAPALGFGERWRNKLPDGDPIVVFNHARGANAPIHRAFFEQMANVDVDREPPAEQTIAIMGTNDESVPYDQVARVWESWEAGLPPGSQLLTIEGGDHGLTAHVDVIERVLRDLC